MNQAVGLERIKKIIGEFPKVRPFLVVGDIGIDKYVMGRVTRISPEAPVPVVEVTKEWYKLGLAANISHNLKSMGVDSTLCGIIGNDQNGTVFEHQLEDVELRTWGIVREEDRPTIIKERVITPTQQICRIDYEKKGPYRPETESKLLNRIFEFCHDHQALILQDHGKGAITEHGIRKLLDHCHENNLEIFVDPSRYTPASYYKGVELLKPNLPEAQLLCKSLGHNNLDLDSMGEVLMEKLDLKYLVITLGPDGMAILERGKGDGKMNVIPTVASEIFDVSGAGDTSIALIAASLAAGASLIEASWIGNCGAAVVVGKKGTATVNSEELFNYYHKISKGMNE